MRALVCKEYGTPDKLVIEDVEDPSPEDGELLIDVHAAGINFPDILVFAGKYQVRTEPPFIPGYEASGVVTATGAGVSGFRPGDRVIVAPMGGGFAEQIVVPESQAFPLPDAMSFAEGAGFPIAYCTSFHALRDCAGLQQGETLLVLGAAGGVGTTAIEIGKAMGALVIAAASSAGKLAFAESVGADHTVNYTDENLRDAVRALTDGKGVNVVYDPVGGELAEQALRSCAWQARYLVVGFASGDIPRLPANLALLKEASIKGVFWGQWAATDPSGHGRNLREMMSMLEAGDIRPRITHCYALGEYVQAYADVAGRRITGKTVFRIR
jgi:NADPH2:quinone reductase